MHRTACTLGRAISHAFFCALLLAGPAYADDAAVSADFDGDGHRDQVTLSLEQPTVLRVWLSATRTTEFVRSTKPLLGVAAADLDGDRRAELIASDGSSLLKIWTTRQNHFRSYRPKQPAPAGFNRTSDRASATDSTLPSPTTSTPRPLPDSLETAAYLSAPISDCCQYAPGARPRANSPLSFTLVAPRPPPAASRA